MQIDAVERTVQISVGELACFQNNSRESFRGGQEWRAELGRKWHKTLQEKTAVEYPLSEFELSLKKTVRKGDWTFKIQGRIDQFVTDGAALNTIREVKTVRHPLPEKPDILKDKYPKSIFIEEYFVEYNNIEIVMASTKCLDLAISNDSGVSHMLSTSYCPLIKLFGPKNSNKFTPLKKNLFTISSTEFNSSDISSIPVKRVIKEVNKILGITS